MNTPDHATGPGRTLLLWHLIDHPRRLAFAEAARHALLAEREDPRMRGGWAAVERARRPHVT